MEQTRRRVEKINVGDLIMVADAASRVTDIAISMGGSTFTLSLAGPGPQMMVLPRRFWVTLCGPDPASVADAPTSS